MSRINKKFKTKHTALEMKNFISTNLLPNPALSGLLNSADWHGDDLDVRSKIGNGVIRLKDYEAEIDINLNFFGSMAKNKIEAAMDTEFKKLK